MAEKGTIGMIFAAGLGTRLAPFTSSAPKALVEVNGVPMLERVIMRFKDAGINRIVINVHHFANQIYDFLDANKNFGVEIKISDETEELLDTGGGILYASRFFKGYERVLAHNADILTNVNIGDMIDRHVQDEADVTLLVSKRESSRYLVFDPRDMKLTGWKNVKTGEVLPPTLNPDFGEDLSFGGVHVLSTKALEALRSYSDENKFSIIPFYVTNCERLNIKGYMPDYPYEWFDVGSPEKLAKATEAAKRLNL